jgi:site-specific DNA-methyltransferase (adenine-specific)
MSIELHNVDCMEYMRGLPDNAFELAIVDPPYGIGKDGQNKGSGKHGGRKAHEWKGWDSRRPSADYWAELQRVSVHRVVWGANYFTEYLPPSMGWVFWDKGQRGLSMSDGELAYTSHNRRLEVVTINRVELLKDGTIHPTQKPVKLYEWLLMNYAKEGDRILDTHLGSGSSAIAAHNCGFDFVGCELDTDYFNAASKRLKQHQAQLTIPID